MGRPRKISSILSKAADHIETHGWIQHGLVQTKKSGEIPPNPKCCAIGAINYVATGNPMDYGNNPDATFDPDTGNYENLGPAGDARDYLRRELPGSGSIPWWNDMQGQTKKKVVAKLREVAAKAKAEKK